MRILKKEVLNEQLETQKDKRYKKALENQKREY